MRLLLLVVLTAGSAAAAEPGGSAEHGKQVFDHWCAPCHAAGPEMAGTQALATKYHGDEPAALEQRTDLTADVVQYSVRHGVTVMPFFRKTEISDTDLDDLSAYLVKQK